MIDSLDPESNNLTIDFAHDVIQIITTDKARRSGFRNRTVALRSQSEVEKQNQYKKKLKIKTNMNKFSEQRSMNP